MRESQESITQWSKETFGMAVSNVRIAARANEEMAELLRALSVDDKHPKAAEEIADVIIVLCRVAQNLGSDICEEIDRKMAINRGRAWKKDGSGHGYHIRTHDYAGNNPSRQSVGMPGHCEACASKTTSRAEMRLRGSDED